MGLGTTGFPGKDVVIRARERMRDVLHPHLGPVLALERANNIAQVLLLDTDEPEQVAAEMLRGLAPAQQRSDLARAVCTAWKNTAG